MRNGIDFSSWQGLLSTVIGLVLITLVAVGIRLLFMQTMQRRRERENRQINERLKTLIAAYKTLGGSFTGDLTVDPTHLRELMRREDAAANPESAVAPPAAASPAAVVPPAGLSDRRRRVRDAVEAALSDVVLLGTEEQVRLAVRAANDMVEGRAVETAELVVSLRTFIRQALDLDPVPVGLSVPKQGPVRPAAGGGRQARPDRGGGSGTRAGAGGQGGDETALPRLADDPTVVPK